MFYLLFFLGDSAQAMVRKMITTKKKPNQSTKVSRRKSKISKESVPSNNRARADRIKSRISFFKIHPGSFGVEAQAIRADGPAD